MTTSDLPADQPALPAAAKQASAPPMPPSVIIAKLALGFQVAVWAYFALLTVWPNPAMQGGPGTPGVPPTTYLDQLLTALMPGAAAAVGLLLALLLGWRRSGEVWIGALSYHLLLGLAVSWFAYRMITEPAPEGMASFVGIVLGVPLVALCVLGVLTLLWPRAVTYCWGRR